ncbi:MAG: hypothetical protein H7Y36_06400 [Armatimonadetes bacterium]|nr:hypothetical protein [Akkermansiaceae bacterium]
MLRYILLLSALSYPLFAGESRNWTSADGSKSFAAEYISREGSLVTLRPIGEKDRTFEIAKLHPDDQRWLDLNAPIAKQIEALPDARAVFDTLLFGESRETVTKKLNASKIVEATIDSAYMGRTGLNGIFRTRSKIGGLHCFLFFDWSESGKLQEITLQTENKAAGEYEDILKPCWSECVDLITTIHGKPTQKGRIAPHESLQEGQMLASHLWKLEPEGSVMLGSARQEKGYQIVVRFTCDDLAK